MALIPPNNRAGIATIVVVPIFSLLAIAAVILRVWARRLKGLLLDGSDWTCIFGLLVALGLFGTLVYDVTQGLGLPMNEVSRQQFINFNKSVLVGLYLWTTSNTLIRISATLLYIRVFTIRKFVILCWIFMGLNIAYAVATYIVALLICKPLAFTWDSSIPGGHCGNRENLYLWHGIQNLLYDVILVGMPMPLLWKLHMPMGKKISLIIIFAMALIICVLTLGRIIEVSEGNVERITQDYVSVSILTMLEPLLGVISCSLPVLLPVAQKLFTSLGHKDAFRSSSGGARSSYVRSIGTKRNVKILDPYALDTDTMQDFEDSPHIRLQSFSEGHYTSVVGP